MSTAFPAAPSLHRLVYRSRQAFAPGLDHDEAIAALIRASIRNNRAVGLTGLLLVHEGWFVQALEGGAAAVTQTYERILSDQRHRDAEVIAAGPAARREFGDWNMCARRMCDADDAILAQLQGRAAFTPAALGSRSALRLLKALRGIQQRTLVRTLA